MVWWCWNAVEDAKQAVETAGRRPAVRRVSEAARGRPRRPGARGRAGRGALISLAGAGRGAEVSAPRARARPASARSSAGTVAMRPT